MTLSSKAKEAFNSLEICEFPDLCEDHPHGYYCRCPLGTQECSNSLNLDAKCVSGSCTGLKTDPERPTHCVDVDECLEGAPVAQKSEDRELQILEKSSVCSFELHGRRSQECKNLYGSFTCNCAKGFRPRRQTPMQRPYYLTHVQKQQGVAAMNAAYLDLLMTMNNFECEDVNECLESAPCSGSQLRPQENTYDGVNGSQISRVLSTETLRAPNIELPLDPVCVNTIGSFECHCPPGYEFNNVFGTCVDKNECADPQAHLCDEQAGEECINLPGGYTCRCDTL